MTPTLPSKPDEPMYLISEKQMRQIQNDCLHPKRSSCGGCECAAGIDDFRASGIGCTFKGANILIEEVIARGPVHSGAQQQAPAQSIQACLAPGYHSCDYKGPTYHTQSKEHDAAIAAQARKEGETFILGELHDALVAGGIFGLGKRLDELRSEVKK